MLHPAPLRRFIWIVIAGVLIGALYGDVHHGAPGVGAMVGGSIGAALFSLERFVLRRNAGGLFGRLPFLPYLALRSLLYAGVILLINAVVDWLMSGQFMVVGSIDFLFSLGLVVVGNLLFSVNDLLAERLGELGFLNLLNRFIVDLSLAIAEAGGEIKIRG
jgi:hypothetical protein